MGVYWEPQRSERDRGSADSPTLFAVPNAAIAIWRGVDDDQHVYKSYFSGNRWTPQMGIPDIGSSHAPSMARSLTRHFIAAWKGAGSDQGIWCANVPAFDAPWSPQRAVPGVGTHDRPALAHFKNRTMMVWRGVNGDQALYWNELLDPINNVWTNQRQVPDASSSHGPALAVINNIVFLFWKGRDNDTRIWSSMFGATGGNEWLPQENVIVFEFDPQTPNINTDQHEPGTLSRPSATAHNNSIVLSWRGSGDQGLWTAAMDVRFGQFGELACIPDRGSSAGPAIASMGTHMLMNWKGANDDQALYYALGR
jgi:hypothetical protein